MSTPPLAKLLLADLSQLLWILLRESENVFNSLAQQMLITTTTTPPSSHENKNTKHRIAFTPPPRMSIPSEVILRLIEKSGIFQISSATNAKNNNVQQQHLHQIRKSLINERKRPSRLTSSQHIELLIEKILFVALGDDQYFFINFFINHLASTLVIAVSTSTESLWRLSCHDAWERAPTKTVTAAKVAIGINTQTTTLQNHEASFQILAVNDLRKELVETCQLVTTLEEVRVLDSILSCYPSDLVETDFEELLGHFFAESPLFVSALFRNQQQVNNNNNIVSVSPKTKSCDEILKSFAQYRLEYLCGEILHVFDGVNKFEIKAAFPKVKNFDNSDDDDDDDQDGKETKLMKSYRKKSSTVTLIIRDREDDNDVANVTKTKTTDTRVENGEKDDDDDADVFQDDVSFFAASAILKQRQRTKSVTKLESTMKRKLSFSQSNNNNNATSGRLSRRMSSFGIGGGGGGSNHNQFQYFEQKVDLKTLSWAVRMIVNTISDMNSAGSEKPKEKQQQPGNEDAEKQLQVLMQIRLFNETSRSEAFRWLTQQHLAILHDDQVGLKSTTNNISTSSSTSSKTDPILEKALGLVALLVTTSDLNSQYLLMSRGKVFASLSKACLLQCERISILKGFAWPPRITREAALSALNFLQAKNISSAATGKSFSFNNSASQLRDLKQQQNTNIHALLNVNLSPSRRMIGKIVATTSSPETVMIDEGDNNNNRPSSQERHKKAKKVNEDFILRRVEKANREMLKIRFQNRIEERKRELLEKQRQEEEESAAARNRAINGLDASVLGSPSPMSPFASPSSLSKSSCCVDAKARVFCMITLCSCRNVRAACHDAISLIDLLQQQANNNNNAAAGDITSETTTSELLSPASTALQAPAKRLKNAQRRASVAIDFASAKKNATLHSENGNNNKTGKNGEQEEKVYDINFQVSASIQNRAGVSLVTSPPIEVSSKTNVIKSNFAEPDDVFCWDPFLSRAVVEIIPKDKNQKRARSVFANGQTLYDQQQNIGEDERRPNSPSKVNASLPYDKRKEDNPFVILKMQEAHSRQMVARKAWYLPEFPGIENAIGDAHFIAKMDVPLNEANIDLDEEDDEELALREENGAFMGLDVCWLFEAIPFYPSRKDKCYIRISIEAICLTKNGKDAALKLFEKNEKDQAQADAEAMSYRLDSNSSLAFGQSVSMAIRNEDDAIISENDLNLLGDNHNKINTILPLIQTLFSGFGEVALSIASRPDDFPIGKVAATSVTPRQTVQYDPSGASFVCSLGQHENISITAFNAEDSVDDDNYGEGQTFAEDPLDLSFGGEISSRRKSSSMMLMTKGVLGKFKINTLELAKQGSGRYCFSIGSGAANDLEADETCEELFSDFYNNNDDENGKRKKQQSASSKVEAVLILTAIPLTPNFPPQEDDELEASARRRLMLNSLSPETNRENDGKKRELVVTNKTVNNNNTSSSKMTTPMAATISHADKEKREDSKELDAEEQEKNDVAQDDEKEKNLKADENVVDDGKEW